MSDEITEVDRQAGRMIEASESLERIMQAIAIMKKERDRNIDQFVRAYLGGDEWMENHAELIEDPLDGLGFDLTGLKTGKEIVEYVTEQIDMWKRNNRIDLAA